MNFDKAKAEELWEEYAKTRAIETRDLLVEMYMPYARGAALRFISRKIPKWLNTLDGEELILAAQAALPRQVERYESGRGIRFLTFATPRIQGAIQDECREMDHLSRLHRERVKKGLEEEVKKSSLSQIVHETDAGADRTIEDFVSDNGKDRPELALLSNDGFEELLVGLNSEEKEVVRGYYRDGLTMRQIADQIGRSESRVSQLHKTILVRIQYCLRQRAESIEDPTDYGPFTATTLKSTEVIVDTPIAPADLMDQLKGITRKFTLDEIRSRLKVTYEEIVLLEALEKTLAGGNGKVTPTITRTAVIPRPYTFRAPGRLTNQGRIMDYLYENRTMSPADMVEDLEIPYGSVYAALSGGKKKGCFDNPERSAWNLTESAREEMTLQRQEKKSA